MYLLNKNEYPNADIPVIGYDKNGRWGLTKYTEVRTWNFKKKMAFVSLPKGFVRTDIVGWNAIPMSNDTYPPVEEV